MVVVLFLLYITINNYYYYHYHYHCTCNNFFLFFSPRCSSQENLLPKPQPPLSPGWTYGKKSPNHSIGKLGQRFENLIFFNVRCLDDLFFYRSIYLCVRFDFLVDIAQFSTIRKIVTFLSLSQVQWYWEWYTKTSINYLLETNQRTVPWTIQGLPAIWIIRIFHIFEYINA